MTTVGLEPTIFGSEDRRLIHWATRPCRKFLSNRLPFSLSENNILQKICRDPGSNRGPPDLQSDALPTELSRRPNYRGSEQRHSELIEPIENFAFLRKKIRTKMDLSGFEPEAFCMQSRRDTTTPQAQNALEIPRKQQSSKVVSHREISCACCL